MVDGLLEPRLHGLVHPEGLAGSGAEVLATYGDDWYKGMSVLTRNRCGKGSVYYLAAKVDQRFIDDATDYVFLMNFNESEAAGRAPRAGPPSAIRPSGNKPRS